MIYIGIDPDNDKNGVAEWDSKSKELTAYNMTFFELFDFLKEKPDKGNITVIVEAGWLNLKSNFHYAGNTLIAQTIAKKVGANHEVGRKLIEMCEYLELKYKTVRPVTSKWKADYCKRVTGYRKRTNQEQRDAIKLVFGL